MAVDGAQVTLGPLEAGRLPLNLKCSGQEESSAHTVLVQPINPKPKVYEPFSPESISLSWGTVILALLLLFVLSGFGLYLWLKRKKKEKQKENTRSKVKEKSPYEKLIESIELATDGAFLASDDMTAIHQLYSQLYTRLRRYFSAFLGLSLSHETSSAYLQIVIPILKKKGMKEIDLGTVKRILNEADRVRFAQEIPQREQRENFLKDLRFVVSLVRSKEESQIKHEMKEGQKGL